MKRRPTAPTARVLQYKLRQNFALYLALCARVARAQQRIVKSVFLVVGWVEPTPQAGPSVIQSRTCSKEESCAAEGHDDNDDNDHSHSDGAAATSGPLAALFITIITIVITL